VEDLGRSDVGFLVAKLMPGVGGRVKIPQGLSGQAAIEWAKETLKIRFADHSGWLNLTAVNRVYLPGIN